MTTAPQTERLPPAVCFTGALGHHEDPAARGCAPDLTGKALIGGLESPSLEELRPRVAGAGWVLSAVWLVQCEDHQGVHR